MKFQLLIVVALAIFVAVFAWDSNESNDVSNLSNDLSVETEELLGGQRPPRPAVAPVIPAFVQKEVVDAVEPVADNLEVVDYPAEENLDTAAETATENVNGTEPVERDTRCKKGKKGKGKKKWGK